MRLPSYIENLRDAINLLHGATAKHAKSVPVKEMFEGKTVWDGVVEVFTLSGHPLTNIIYAWSVDSDEPEHRKKHFTVLHLPPVVSPETAVRAVIVQEHRRNAKKREN